VEPHEYASHDAVGLRDLIRAGDVTSAEVETAARSALERANAEVNGLALPLFEPALDHAPDGPFAGVPFLIKDGGPVAKGVPFCLGSRAIRGAVAAPVAQPGRRAVKCVRPGTGETVTSANPAASSRAGTVAGSTGRACRRGGSAGTAGSSGTSSSRCRPR
jgi:hypothetical protein